MNFLTKSRVDCLVIWGNGKEYISQILHNLDSDSELEILLIKKIKPKKIKTLVNKIYSFDYAPIIHLKGKIKYLKTIDPETTFIFIKNLKPNIEYFGNGKFRHIESLKIKKLKTELREKYNPRLEDGRLTENHIVHATDNESQTDSILKILGYRQGLKIFNKKDSLIDIPFYIDYNNEYTFKVIPCNQLFCSNLIQLDSKVTAKRIPLYDSIQYRSIDNINLYQEYIQTYLGLGLNSYYDVNKYLRLINDFQYLKKPYNHKYVLVKYIENNNYLIVDGLHRAAIHAYQGNKNILVCIL